MQKKIQFVNTFCFTDELCAINNNSEIEKNFEEVVNNLVSKRTLNHLAKLVSLTKLLSVPLRTN